MNGCIPHMLNTVTTTMMNCTAVTWKCACLNDPEMRKQEEVKQHAAECS